MKRRRFTPEQKVAIIREHFKKNISAPDICEKYRIHPNQFYHWKKEFFECAVDTFSKKRGKKIGRDKTTRLEEKLKDRNEVIAELLEENIKLKKSVGEI